MSEEASSLPTQQSATGRKPRQSVGGAMTAPDRDRPLVASGAAGWTSPAGDAAGSAAAAEAAAAAAAVDASKRTAATLTAFAVQCSLCFKWRRVPTLEEYESIRARVSANPFTCEHARRWRPTCSCDDAPDLEQDGSLLWAMDRQDIPQPPAGWRRRIVVRGGTSNKFSDVYYHSPCGRSLRSLNDVERFLVENPKYRSMGISVKQFSFSAPRPLTDKARRQSAPAALPGSSALPGPSPVSPSHVHGHQQQQQAGQKRAQAQADGGGGSVAKRAVTTASVVGNS